MAANESSAGSWLSDHRRPPADRRQTLVMVRWALIISCAYLILFSEGTSGMRALGPWVIVVFLTSNLVVGRLQAEVVATQSFNIAIALFDTVLIAASLFCAGQVSVELVVLLLGVLVLAIAGLQSGVIAIVTLGMTAAYILMMWAAGHASLTRSSMLLQVPFLLCAAMVYGWVTEAAHAERVPPTSGARSATGSLAPDLTAQLEAIQRCQAMISEGSHGAVLATLDEMAARNREMQGKLTAGEPVPAGAVSAAPSLARSTA